jgi:2-keto-4-pentenoate hydratase
MRPPSTADAVLIPATAANLLVALVRRLRGRRVRPVSRWARLWGLLLP